MAVVDLTQVSLEDYSRRYTLGDLSRTAATDMEQSYCVLCKDRSFLLGMSLVVLDVLHASVVCVTEERPTIDAIQRAMCVSSKSMLLKCLESSRASLLASTPRNEHFTDDLWKPLVQKLQDTLLELLSKESRDVGKLYVEEVQYYSVELNGSFGPLVRLNVLFPHTAGGFMHCLWSEVTRDTSSFDVRRAQPLDKRSIRAALDGGANAVSDLFEMLGEAIDGAHCIGRTFTGLYNGDLMILKRSDGGILPLVITGVTPWSGIVQSQDVPQKIVIHVHTVVFASLLCGAGVP